jgi:hypothetical protein
MAVPSRFKNRKTHWLYRAACVITRVLGLPLVLAGIQALFVAKILSKFTCEKELRIF